MGYVRERSYLRLHVCTLEPNEGPLVAHLIAVVRRTENGKCPTALLVFVSVVFHLVASHEQLYVIVTLMECTY